MSIVIMDSEFNGTCMANTNLNTTDDIFNIVVKQEYIKQTTVVTIFKPNLTLSELKYQVNLQVTSSCTCTNYYNMLV